MGSGNKAFHFDCGIDLSRCGIAMVAPVVQGLFLAAST